MLMKKLLFLLGCAVLISACKKNAEPDTPTGQNTKYPTTFKVADFTFNNITIPTTGSNSVVPLQEVFTNLYFLIFDSNGKVISRLEQQSNGTDSLFRITSNARKLVTTKFTYGTITDSLVVGKYTLVAVGGRYRLMFNPDVYPAPGTDLFPATDLLQTGINFGEAGMTESTYVYKGEFQVRESASEHRITLDRIGGLLEIKIEDAMPSNTYTIAANITTEFANYNLGGSLPWKGGTGTSFIADPIDWRGIAGFTMSKYMLNTVIPFEVELVAIQKGGNQIARKKISPVFIETNKKTILSGKLFDGMAASGFNVSIDKSWMPNTTVVKF